MVVSVAYQGRTTGNALRVGTVALAVCRVLAGPGPDSESQPEKIGFSLSGALLLNVRIALTTNFGDFLGAFVR